jgi:hypothetical protein
MALPIEIAVTARRMGGALRETHHLSKRQLMGIAALHPSYGLQLMSIASLHPSCKLLRVVGWTCHIAATGEQAGDGNVLVERFPVQSDAAQLKLFALGGRRAQQSGEPGERHAERPPVGQFDPHRAKRTLVAEVVIRSIVARMERSAIRDRGAGETGPDFASLHPGYTCYGLTTSLFCGLIDPASDIAMAVA